MYNMCHCSTWASSRPLRHSIHLQQEGQNVSLSYRLQTFIRLNVIEEDHLDMVTPITIFTAEGVDVFALFQMSGNSCISCSHFSSHLCTVALSLLLKFQSRHCGHPRHIVSQILWGLLWQALAAWPRRTALSSYCHPQGPVVLLWRVTMPAKDRSLTLTPGHDSHWISKDWPSHRSPYKALSGSHRLPHALP